MISLYQYLTEGAKEISAYCRKYKQYGSAWMGIMHQPK
jgi:hypothetical protein